MSIILRRIAYGVFLLSLLIGAFVLYQLWKYEVFKTPVYEQQPPQLPPAQFDTRVLVFSKTNDFRHLEAIPAAEDLFRQFAAEQSWDVFITENGAVHQPELLSQFDLLVWNNVTGDVLTTPQREALKHYLESGGRFLGLHGTGGNPEYDWSWFPKAVIKSHFIGHPMFPQFRDGTLLVEDQKHPATEHLPASMAWHEEWYSFSDNAREAGAQVLISVDEETYDVPDSLKMGKDHPLVWHHKLGKGTVFYSSLGHRAEAYQDPQYQQLLRQASLWLLAQ